MSRTSSQISSPPAVAVFGLGRMGTPIAHNLIAAGFPVEVWDRTTAHAAPLESEGATIAASPAAAAQRADVVLTMLPDGHAVEEVMSGPAGALAAMRTGTPWIQMGTIGLDWIERDAALATENGVDLVDAPVSGSDGPARDRQLVILASGPETARARVQPIFDALGRETIWLGAAGNGTRLKLALNNWLAVQVEGRCPRTRPRIVRRHDRERTTWLGICGFESTGHDRGRPRARVRTATGVQGRRARARERPRGQCRPSVDRRDCAAVATGDGQRLRRRRCRCGDRRGNNGIGS